MNPRLDAAAEEETLRQEIRLLLTAASDLQWRTPGSSSAADDTARRSQGGHSDPTPEIALDDRRLALREAVKRARVSLVLPWLYPLADARDALSDALSPYGEVV